MPCPNRKQEDAEQMRVSNGTSPKLLPPPPHRRCQGGVMGARRCRWVTSGRSGQLATSAAIKGQSPARIPPASACGSLTGDKLSHAACQTPRGAEDSGVRRQREPHSVTGILSGTVPFTQFNHHSRKCVVKEINPSSDEAKFGIVRSETFGTTVTSESISVAIYLPASF